MALIVKEDDKEQDDIINFSDSSDECDDSDEYETDSFIDDESIESTETESLEESEWVESDTDSEPEPKRFKQ